MTRGRRAWPIAVVVCLLATTGWAQTPGPALPVSEYIGQLDLLMSAIRRGPDGDAPAAAILEHVPTNFRVSGASRVFEIPTTALRRDFRTAARQHDAVARQRLLSTLRMMRSEAVRFETPVASQQAARAQLATILGRREFEDLHGPTWVDRLRQRVLVWLTRVLGGVVERAAIPTIGRVVVYTMITAAVLLLLFVGFRALARDEVPGGFGHIQVTNPEAEGPQWLAAAQDAATRGNWRDAIHCTYWTAVAFLERRDAWRVDRARTPRECLRLLPPASQDHGALADLTRRLELVWYGNGTADADMFADALASLRRLGCPSA
jgi:hypothetical protein